MFNYLSASNNYYCSFCRNFTYALHLESLNTLLVLLSIQMFQPQTSSQFSIYRFLMQGRWSVISSLFMLFSLFHNPLFLLFSSSYFLCFIIEYLFMWVFVHVWVCFVFWSLCCFMLLDIVIQHLFPWPGRIKHWLVNQTGCGVGGIG